MAGLMGDVAMRDLDRGEVDVFICRGGAGCQSGGAAICEACYRFSLDDPRTDGEVYDAMRRGDA